MSGRLELEHLVLIRPVGPGSWSPNGKAIAFIWADRAGANYLWACDPLRGWTRKIGDRRIVLEMHEGTDRRDVWGGPQWSPVDSRLLVVSRSTRDPRHTSLWTVDFESGAEVELTHHNGSDRAPRWSPNGKNVAFVCHRNGRDDLQIVPAEGGVGLQLTYDRWDNIDLDWSPDGRRIVYISQRSDVDLFSNNLCVVPTQGGPPVQLTKGDTDNDRSPRWSPDGSRIAFVSNRSDNDDIWCVDADGQNLRPLTSGKGDKADPRWSPDGKWIVYTHFSGGGFNLCLIPAAGGEPQVVVSGGCNVAPRWSPDGTTILYHRSGADLPGDLWSKVLDMPSSNPGRQITNCGADRLSGVHFSHPESVTYSSKDGLEIEGLLYRRTDGCTLPGPAIVYVHGGPNSVHVNGWSPLLQYLVQRGYTIFAPNYRGSTGYGKRFMEANIGEEAGGDLDDWVEAAKFLRNLPDVDANCVAIMGRSAGGYAALLAMGQKPEVFQAGIAISAPSNWLTYWEETEIPWTRRFRMKLMGLPSANLELYRRRAPITFASNIQGPVLLLHGESDPGVPSGQAREMAAELARLGKKHECVIYAGEGHQSTGETAITDAAQQIARFLSEHLSSPRSKCKT